MVVGAPAIRVRGIGKRYLLGETHVRYRTFRDAITNLAKAPIGRLLHGRPQRQELWALKDIDLDVEQGEVVGIIGRNGAGKSTLLKIVSRITEPTEGRIELWGHVASLLEVGTGFHPELTGRENIFLSGSILGMSRAEIQSKFDEIVAFAEVEKFIDTPAKRYSSGMYVRLAFAVAAHLEPEILLVDEVLAVGDAAFQKKCLGKMQDVSQSGRTILFVSHNMAAISKLCHRGVLLESGRITNQGPADQIVQHYVAGFEQQGTTDLARRTDRRGDGRLRITGVTLADGAGNAVPCWQSGTDAQIILDYEAPSNLRLRNVIASLAIDTIWGQRLCVLQSDYVGADLVEIGPRGHLVCRVPKVPLAAGLYPFTIFVTVNGIIADWVIRAGTITVEQGDFYGHGRYPGPTHGSVLMRHSWSCYEEAL
jgi:lipopolysaccharide transport system ATP-binding protein